MTIQEMIKILKNLRTRVEALEQAQTVTPPPPVEIPVEMEPVIRRGRPRKVEVTESAQVMP